MNENYFSLCHLENNKIIYESILYDINKILNNISDSIVLIFDNDAYNIDYFISNKKYRRYFKDEKYNFEKTSYICWNDSSNIILINLIIAEELLLFLPKSIKYIKFNNNFNNNIDILTESNITHIIFGNKFNQKIDNLPWTIEYLYFGQNFNQKLDNIPGCLKKLIFSCDSDFNQELDCLPNYLEYLFLPKKYSNKLNNLPNFLSHIELNCEYPHTLNNLPKLLEKFIFYSTTYNEYDLNKCTIYTNKNIFEIPTLPCYYDDSNKSKLNIDWIEKIFVKLPPNLKFLDLSYSYKLNMLSDYVEYNSKYSNQHVKKELIKNSQILDNLPENLQVLKYPSNYNLILIEKIPQNIQRLFLSHNFNQSVDKLLNPNFKTSNPSPPTKLTHLIFGNKFNQSVSNLPSSITHLFFGSDFNKSVNNLPNSLKIIVFGNNFNNSIMNLPPNIISIKFGQDFNQDINCLKPLVQEITFSKYVKYNIYDINKYYDNNKCKCLPRYSTIKKCECLCVYKYNYNKTINKLPANIKIFLPNITLPHTTTLDDFYSIFSNYKDNIEYY